MSEQVLKTYRLSSVTSLDTIEFEQESFVPLLAVAYGAGLLGGMFAAKAMGVSSLRRVRFLNKIGNFKEGNESL